MHSILMTMCSNDKHSSELLYIFIHYTSTAQPTHACVHSPSSCVQGNTMANVYVAFSETSKECIAHSSAIATMWVLPECQLYTLVSLAYIAV